MTFKIISYFILLFVGCRSSVLPAEKCHLEDSTCMKSAFQNAVPMYIDGVPEMGIEKQDPLKLDNFEFDLSGLQFSLKDGLLAGLKNSVIDDVKWDLKKKQFKVTFHIDATVTGKYTAAGTILTLPISGNGDITIKAKNMQLIFVIPYEIQKDSNGKDHFVPKKINFEFEVRDNTHFLLTNLFDGNKELSDAMHKFLNDNWKIVSGDFGKPFVSAAAKTILKNVVKFFKVNAIPDIAKV